MTSATPLFELRQVSQHFGSFVALDQLTLQIYPGERVALVGSSGAGKSTLLALLNGTLSPTHGAVWALGHNLGRLSGARLRRIQRQIGTIYQQFHLVDSLKVVHNVNAGQLGRWPLWKAALSLIHPLDVATAAKALHRVGIPEKLYDRTDRLSGGQQQRVAIARVLVQNPMAILADEPVSSLDPELSREVMDLLRDLVQEEHKTLVVSLHSVDLARSHCDRIIGLRAGRIVFDAPSSTITDAMLNDLYRLRE
ncbi:MAG TPA: phosphonate ABC transporter ATP-binding protein [Crinalium sp.]|jgi:phosphonate transport system ATP-binding protein